MQLAGRSGSSPGRFGFYGKYIAVALAAIGFIRTPETSNGQALKK